MELTEQELFKMANDTDFMLALMDAEDEIRAKNPLRSISVYNYTIGDRKILIKKLLEKGFKLEKIKK